MSIFPDIDATCSSLGYHDGVKYHADPDFLQCLKVGHFIEIIFSEKFNHFNITALDLDFAKGWRDS